MIGMVGMFFLKIMLELYCNSSGPVHSLGDITTSSIVVLIMSLLSLIISS